MSMKPLLLSAVAVLGLLLPQNAHAAAPKPPQSMNAPVYQLRAPWAVQPISKGDNFASCRVSAQFDNDTIMQFTHSSTRGLENVSIAFGGSIFTPRQIYPVSVSAPNMEAQTIDATAINGSTIMLALGKVAVTKNDVWNSALVTLGIDGATYRFSLAGLEQTKGKLNDCLHPAMATDMVNIDSPPAMDEGVFVPVPPANKAPDVVTIGKNEAPAPTFEVIDAAYPDSLPSPLPVSTPVSEMSSTANAPQQPVKPLTVVSTDPQTTRKILDQTPVSAPIPQPQAPMPRQYSTAQDIASMTRMYQESEKQNQALGQQLLQEREQWAQERKAIEAKLFDPQIADEEQRLKLYDLEKKVSELEKALGEKAPTLSANTKE